SYFRPPRRGPARGSPARRVTIYILFPRCRRGVPTLDARLVEVGTGHVVAADRIGAEQLALALEERTPAVGTDSLRPRRLVIARARFAGKPCGRRRPERSARRHGFFPPAAGDTAPAGVTVGSGPVFRTSPAGVRRTEIGVLSGVGTTWAEPSAVA